VREEAARLVGRRTPIVAAALGTEAQLHGALHAALDLAGSLDAPPSGD
jgi:hypothetical protein